MHRTQIYLQDELYEQLKLRSRAQGVTISELIRRAVAKDFRGGSGDDARAFFERLRPLESFRDQEPEEYVDRLRSRSRIVQENVDGKS